MHLARTLKKKKKAKGKIENNQRLGEKKRKMRGGDDQKGS